MGDGLATIDMGRKLGGLRSFGEDGSPSKTVWLGKRPNAVPSFVLIHLTVYRQTAGQTDRQDNGPIAQGEPFYKRSPKKLTSHRWYRTAVHWL